MKPLFKHSKRILSKIKRSSHVYLFLDYDGTLTPIVSKPELANFPAKTKLLLEELLKKKNIFITVVSGRPIKQLKKKIRIKGLALAGNHGLEFTSKNFDFAHPEINKSKKLIKAIANELKKACRPIMGAFLEDKGLTLSVHFRLVKEKDMPRLFGGIYGAIMPHLNKKRIKVTFGKKVIEIRPPIKWGKASLIAFLLKQKNAKQITPVYIGDDKTDEQAFQILRKRKRGITIFVGEGHVNSNAEYFVKDTKAVVRFLRLLNSA